MDETDYRYEVPEGDGEDDKGLEVPEDFRTRGERATDNFYAHMDEMNRESLAWAERERAILVSQNDWDGVRNQDEVIARIRSLF